MTVIFLNSTFIYINLEFSDPILHMKNGYWRWSLSVLIKRFHDVLQLGQNTTQEKTKYKMQKWQNTKRQNTNKTKCKKTKCKCEKMQMLQNTNVTKYKKTINKYDKTQKDRTQKWQYTI